MNSNFRGIAVLIGILSIHLSASATTWSPSAVWVSGREDITFTGTGFETGYNCTFAGSPTLSETVVANVTNATSAKCKSPDFSLGYTVPVNVSLLNKAGEPVATFTLTILDTRTREATCEFPKGNSSQIAVTKIDLKQVAGNPTTYFMNNTNITNNSFPAGSYVFHVHVNPVNSAGDCASASTHLVAFGQNDIPNNNGAAQAITVTSKSVSVNIADTYTQLTNDAKTGALKRSIVVHDSLGTPAVRYACCNIVETVPPTASGTIVFVNSTNVTGSATVTQEAGKKAKIQLALLKSLNQAWSLAIFDSCATSATQYPSSKYPFFASFNKEDTNVVVEAHEYLQLLGDFSVLNKAIAVFPTTATKPLKFSDNLGCALVTKNTTPPPPTGKPSTPVSGAASLHMGWLALLALAFFWVNF